MEGGDPFAFRPTEDRAAKAPVALWSEALAALSSFQHAGQRHSMMRPLGSFRRERRQPKDVLMSV